MKSTWALLFLIILCTPFSQAQTDGFPLSYTCYHLSSPIQLDGDLSDPGWRDIPWSTYFRDIEGDAKPTPLYQTRMKLAWDDNFLYIAAHLEEPHLFGTLRNRDTIIFHDHDFEVFIDPDGDSRNYYEFEINVLGTEMDLFMAKPYNRGGSARLDWNFADLRSTVRSYGSLNNPGDTDSCWTVEIMIPWTAFQGGGHIDPRPEGGDTWRMNFSRVQWKLEVINGAYRKIRDPETGKPLPENNWVWSPQGVVNMHVPEHWGYVNFSDTPPLPRFWVWMGGRKRTSVEWTSILEDLDTLGIRGILLGADSATLGIVAKLSASYGIQIHAWVWTMNRGDGDTSWLDYNRLGQSLATHEAYVGYYKFLNPAIPEVRGFLAAKFQNLSKIKGLSGVHMDYVRYVDVILPSGLQPKYGLVQDYEMPRFDYGFHPVMREKYKAKHGIDPIDIAHPEADTTWIRFRLGELNEAVGLIRDQVKENRLPISAAVFPTPEMSRKMVRQDWDRWNLDCYFPMVYHNFYEKSFEWIQQVMEENKKALPTTPIFCGLFLPALQQEDDLTKAMEAAFKGGADGISFFSYGSFSDSLRQQIYQISHIRR